MQIKVDLKTRILPPDHNVFVARPGRNSRLYTEFLQASMIGPELPALKLRPGIKIREHRDIEDQIKRANAIRSWVNQGKQRRYIPPTGIQNYKELPKTRGQPQFLSILEGYFEEAKKGDLVIIPPSAYSSQTIIGEFTQDPSNIRYIRVDRYGKFDLPARRFKRLSPVEKRRLPGPILDVIAKPQVLVSVGRTSRPFLYDLAYGSYVIQENYNTRIDLIPIPEIDHA